MIIIFIIIIMNISISEISRYFYYTHYYFYHIILISGTNSSNIQQKNKYLHAFQTIIISVLSLSINFTFSLAATVQSPLWVVYTISLGRVASKRVTTTIFELPFPGVVLLYYSLGQHKTLVCVLVTVLLVFIELFRHLLCVCACVCVCVLGCVRLSNCVFLFC